MLWLVCAARVASAAPDLLDEREAWSVPADSARWSTDVVRSGDFSLQIERDADSEGRFTSVERRIPVDVRGRTVELSGYVRAEDVDGSGGLWVQTFAPGGRLLSQTSSEPIDEEGAWIRHRVQIALDARADAIVVSGYLTGTGSLWVDDLTLKVNRRPIARARPRPPSLFWDDDRFDDGSGLHLDALTAVQVDNLVLLAEVWGFLKYHHPTITSGALHWDYELLAALPAVLDAPDARAGRAAITDFALGVGVPAPCRPCATLPPDRHLEAELDWISDVERLGEPLVEALQAAYISRPADGAQVYVQTARGVGNPVFLMERGYAELEDPDAGYRILAAFRLWNIIRYWSPYRDVIDEDWRTVLASSLPLLVEAREPDDYTLALIRLLSTIADSHTNLWGSLDAVPPRGEAWLPIQLRFVAGVPVVWEAARDAPLQVGDVLVSLDEEPISALMERMRSYYPASNEPTRLRDMARRLTRGPPGPVSVAVLRGDTQLTVTAERASPALSMGHDRHGDPIQILGERVAYVKLSSLELDQIDALLAAAQGRDGLIIDIRNYPAAFVVSALGRHLLTEPTSFVRFTICDTDNPGVFVWNPLSTLAPEAPTVGVPIIILVDETTQSQAEYTSMAFRSAPNARVVGSTTAGADGNVSHIPLPGGHRTMISGIGVFYPDKTPTQRVGIVPDVEVLPTIEGIRAGRDEVLEAALRLLLGDDVGEEDIVELTRRVPPE